MPSVGLRAGRQFRAVVQSVQQDGLDREPGEQAAAEGQLPRMRQAESRQTGRADEAAGDRREYRTGVVLVGSRPPRHSSPGRLTAKAIATNASAPKRTAAADHA
jgi:hypothetical protein